jgi:hypothetical protein
MHYTLFTVGCASLLLTACSTMRPPTTQTPSGGTPVSMRKHFELTTIADELKYESGDVLSAAAKQTSFDECLEALDCAYCREGEGWWMRQSCR